MLLLLLGLLVCCSVDSTHVYQQPKPLPGGDCKPGMWIRRTFYNVTCAPCATGTFSPGNYSKCLPCPSGYATAQMGSSQCNLCAVNYYASSNQRNCISCADPTYNIWASGNGIGWVTFGVGSTSINQCYDLDFAVLFGWIWLLFVAVFTTFMICDGYIHKIAFFRNLRVTQVMTDVRILTSGFIHLNAPQLIPQLFLPLKLPLNFR